MRREKTVTLPISKQSIVIKAPTVGIMKRALNTHKDQLSQTINIIASCTNLTEEELDSLEWADFEILQVETEGFITAKKSKE